jgi:CHAT domain-containing protein
LGLSENIEGAVRQYRAVLLRDEVAMGRLQPEAVGHEIDYPGTEAAIGAVLRGIIDRLRPALGDRKRLFLAPDGLLNELPFEVLPLDDGRRLGDEFEISYVSSGRTLLRLQDVPGPTPQPAVVVAAPAFDLCASDQPESWFRPLPDTLVEGKWVAERLGVELWSDDQATETRVKAVRSPGVLHIATHGFFLDHTPRRRNAVSGGRNNPLLRSGLALAGADDWFEGVELPPEAEDGLLTAEDVSSMDLRGTNLVVLSACETGLGEYRLGEGVFGLRRAFELAGARSLLMSLWRVPSGPTRELMQHFYRQLESGKRRSEALSEARRILQRSYPEPLYWGAFVLSGDAGPMPLSSSQESWITR